MKLVAGLHGHEIGPIDWSDNFLTIMPMESYHLDFKFQKSLLRTDIPDSQIHPALGFRSQHSRHEYLQKHPKYFQPYVIVEGLNCKWTRDDNA